MLAFREFEVEAIEIMLAGVLTSEQLLAVKQHRGPVEIEHTGAGYFVTVSHPLLPEASSTASTPAVIGESGGLHCGFVVFLSNQGLTLECHAWSSEEIPKGFREGHVVISTPAINTGSLPRVVT
jgi:hypothetical protein